jgi:hypothetical protein
MRGEDVDEQNQTIKPSRVRNQGQRSIAQSLEQDSIEIDSKQKNFITV